MMITVLNAPATSGRPADSLRGPLFRRRNPVPLFSLASRLLLTFATLGLLLSPGGSSLQAQEEFEQAPIHYGTTPTTDQAALLDKKLASGEAKLEYDSRHGYLPSLLKLLDIPVSSQGLVYSKTSLQIRRISPQTPRAIYFNDDTYVGWVQDGSSIEIMSTDPVQGQIFYTLDPEQTDQPLLARDHGQCLACHATSRTLKVPGVLIRSVFVDNKGQRQFGTGEFSVDHRSPFKERWGGWYVTGTHGDMRHLGNVILQKQDDADEVDRDAGANIVDLTRRCDLSAYLTPHSDLVALMVLEHQGQMHNYITLASYEGRMSDHYDGIMNAALKRPADHVSDTSRRRITSAGNKLLRYLLFADEFRLTAPVRGTSDFTREFAARGPRDSQGRSLRDFDLQTRMFKYPCSYLIYSAAFDSLPEGVRTHVLTRLHAILTGEDQTEEFAHLSADDRLAILQILKDTKPDLWKD